MNKYEFYRQFEIDNIKELQQSVKQNLINRYYNIWMNKFKWNGLDENTKEEQENYIMRKLWDLGTIAVRPIKNTDMLVFCPYTTNRYNIYDYPETITLVNVRGVSKRIIPNTVQIVNRDACVIWGQPNHKPIKDVVNFYIDRISQIEMCINTNLCLHKIPFLIGCTEEDKKQLEDVVRRILNNEVVIFTGISDLGKIQAMITAAPYIIDKLRTYQVSLENDLLTFLGIDNSGNTSERSAQLTVDEVNANNDAINDYGMAIEDEIRRGLEQVNRFLNRNITIEPKQVVIDSVNDQQVKGHKPMEENEND